MSEKTTRRGFLGAILAAAAAPAIVKAGILMPVRPRIIVPPQKIIVDTANEVWNSAGEWTMTTVNGSSLRNGDIITMQGVYAPDGSLQRLQIKHMTQHTFKLRAWR